MAKKRSMEALINAAKGDTTGSSEVTNVVTTELHKSPSEAVPDKPGAGTKGPATSQVEQLARSEAPKLLPRWTIFEAVTARIRGDQRAALTQSARQLNRAKPKDAERITENTLIRVAIDLLFAHQAELVGATEEELRTAVLRNLSTT